MTITIQPLAESQYLPPSVGLAYTGNTGKTVVTQFTLANNSGGNAVASVWVVPAGGASGNDNLLWTSTLAGGESRALTQLINLVLSSNSTIQWSASVASAIAGRISGYVQT